jgi:ribosomal protein L10
MSSSAQRKAKKRELIKKLYDRVSKHKQIILVTLLNVGSNQVQQIRQKLLQKNSELFIGKNVMIKKTHFSCHSFPPNSNKISFSS